MSRTTKNTHRQLRLAVIPGAVAIMLSGMTLPASAYEIDTGNPDISLNWNNTLRYNWARRMQSIDTSVARAAPAAGAGPFGNYNGYGTSDYLFDKGDTITNRLDLLTELNFVYQGKYGFRTSAAGWYDRAYANKNPTPDPTVPGRTTPYQGNDFSDVVKRYYEGPSGEWLDAYVFGNFDLAGTDLNVRLGRHSVVWGEGLIGSNHSIAYSQAPSDQRKIAANPGASAKETALPVNQVSATAIVSPALTLLAQYQFEWLPNRVPEGGTYFAPGDVVLWGPNINRNTEFKRGEDGGYGLGLKWTPEWLDGTLGVYFRKFDDKGGWLAQPTNVVPSAAGIPTVVGANPFDTTAVWAKGIKLYGISLSKDVAGVSMAAEVSYREDGPLASSAVMAAGAAGNFEGAIGDTWHGLLNGIKSFGSSPVFDSASLVGEVAWSRLDKVTKNRSLFRKAGYGGPGSDCFTVATREIRGCVEDDFYAATVSFTPNWVQVFPGIDMSMPLLYQQNFGNAPSFGGGSDGFITYKAGVTATAWTRHFFDLSYTWWDQKVNRAVPLGTATQRLVGPPYSDKGYLSFTYQTTF